MAVGDPKLARLLEHPAIWRGRSAARRSGLPSGFAALDEHLPGQGWPRTGLIEILVARFGSGELTVLLPTLAALTRAAAARWCVWIAPPLIPFAPALVDAGIALDRVAVVDGTRPVDNPMKSRLPPLTTIDVRQDAQFPGDPGDTTPGDCACPDRQVTASRQDAQFPGDPGMWAFEQTLRSGACDVVLGWARRLRLHEVRRLQLAAERGRALGVLFRPQRAARESSSAVLRLGLEPLRAGVRVTLLKGRSTRRETIDLIWPWESGHAGAYHF